MKYYISIANNLRIIYSVGNIIMCVWGYVVREMREARLVKRGERIIINTKRHVVEVVDENGDGGTTIETDLGWFDLENDEAVEIYHTPGS